MSDPERERAIRLANEVLDRPYADPDDDLAVLARQFLRECERSDFAWRAAYGRGELGVASHMIRDAP